MYKVQVAAKFSKPENAAIAREIEHPEEYCLESVAVHFITSDNF